MVNLNHALVWVQIWCSGCGDIPIVLVVTQHHWHGFLHILGISEKNVVLQIINILRMVTNSGGKYSDMINTTFIYCTDKYDPTFE